MNKYVTLLTSLATAALFTACSPSNPNYTGNPDVAVSPPEKPAPFSVPKDFKMEVAQITPVQPNYGKNTVTVPFEVTDGKGLSVPNLSEKDFTVQENGKNISPFKVTANSRDTTNPIDIVLAVDTTKSMIPHINTAMRKLVEFVRNSRKPLHKGEKPVHTRICFMTFGDTIGRKCDQWFNNDPSLPSTQIEVDHLISELENLTALPKNDDPRNTDFPENSMLALIDATKVNWGQNSQRFIVLVTDANHLSDPDDLGDMYDRGQLPADQKPPTRQAVDQAIHDAQASVFIVAPSSVCADAKHVQDIKCANQAKYPPQKTDYQEVALESPKGQFFEFGQVMADKKESLNPVFEAITHSSETTYQLQYIVEDSGGAPNLSAGDRHVSISTNAGKTTVGTVASTNGGHPAYANQFALSTDAIDANSVHAWINGKSLTAGTDFKVEGSNVVLTQTPAPGAQLRFTFTYQDMSKNLRVEQIAVNGGGDPNHIRVELNGQVAKATDYTISEDSIGNAIVHLQPSILSGSDPYKIRANGGVHVVVTANAY